MSTPLKKLSVATVAFALCFPTFTFANNESIFERLTGRVLQDTIDNNFDHKGISQGMTGVIGGFLTNQNNTYTSGAGYREMNTDGTANTNTAIKEGDMMRVGSQTKTYIGTLVLQLIDQGQLKTTDTLGELNQRLNLGINLSIAPGAEKTTVQQLLTMSSGIKDYLHVPYTDKDGQQWESFSQYVESNGREISMSPNDLIQLGLTGYFDAPSEGFDGTYSNTNTTILGLVAEKITGQKLNVLVSEMLEKLHLTNDQIFFPNNENKTLDNIKDKLVHGYINDNGGLKDVTTYDPSVPWAAGAIVADAKSQLLWLSSLVKNTGTLLKDETFQNRLESAQWTDGEGKNLVDVSTFVTQYGQFLYTMVSPVTGQDIIGHAGSITGYVSMLGWFPHLDMGLVANTAGGSFNSSGIVTSVAAPFFNMELALTRAKYASGDIIHNTDANTSTILAGKAQFYEGRPNLEVGTRGIVRLDPIKTGEKGFGHTITIESTQREITYVEPETIPYMNQTVTTLDPTLTFYKDFPTSHSNNENSTDSAQTRAENQHVAALEARDGGQIIIRPNARVEARSSGTSAVSVSGGGTLIEGQAAAYGKDAYGLRITKGQATIEASGLVWAQGLEAAGLYVEDGKVTLRGNAQGSWGAHALLMKGGVVDVHENAQLLASTLCISGLNDHVVKAPVTAIIEGGTLNIAGIVNSQYSSELPGLALSATGGEVTVQEGGKISGRIELGGFSKLTFAPGSTLAIDLSRLTPEDYVIAYKENSDSSPSQLTVNDNAQLVIDGAKLDGHFRFLDPNLKSSNNPWSVDLGTYLLKSQFDDETGELIIKEGVAVKDIPYITQDQTQMVSRLLASGIHRSDDSAGVAFLSQLFDDRIIDRNNAIATWQSLADIPGVLNVANTTLGVSSQLSTIWRNRLAQIATPQQEDKAGYFWATPWYSHHQIDGLSTGLLHQNAKTNAYGLAMGLEINDQDVLVGLSLQAGRSETTGKGLWHSLSASGDFFGMGAYAGFRIGPLSLLSDFSVTTLDSDLSNNPINGQINSLNSSVLSAGAYLQTQFTLSPSWSLTPFTGARFNHYRQKGYRVTGHNADFFEAGKTHANQVTFPIGAKLRWETNQEQTGRRIRGHLQMAYLHTTGDLGIHIPVSVSGRKDLGVARFSSLITDRHRYQANLALETQKDNLTLGISFGGEATSNQQELNATANIVWRF